MDGNGRWATTRRRPRSMGHKAGVKAARKVVEACAERDISTLTLFAFSSENWKRPASEVRVLMELFLRALHKEVTVLHENNVRLRFIGDRTAFAPELQNAMTHAESLTADNSGINLVIAANYGGRWDITQAAKEVAQAAADGSLDPADVTAETIQKHTALNALPEPDLLIRTGGERRLSNFLLWQFAYTELYFTDTLWPDFDSDALDAALSDYAHRQRRFGLTGEQVQEIQSA